MQNLLILNTYFMVLSALWNEYDPKIIRYIPTKVSESNTQLQFSEYNFQFRGNHTIDFSGN